MLALFLTVAFSIANNAIATGCTTSSTTSGNYTIVSITSTGTCTWDVPSYVNTVDVLLVGGGGAGGSANNGAGGGGGGGQVKTQTNYSVSGTLSITVGAGGVPTSTASLTPGGDGGTTSVTPSSGSAITAIGGSGGASVTPAGNGVIGSPSNTGFNGGGGSTWASSATSGSSGMVGGFSGGNAFGSGVSADVQAAGGGGGSGANGSNAASAAGGNGGSGSTSSVTGNTTYYGGGGGGGKRSSTGTSGNGGTGGGGAGGKDTAGSSGTTNTGGGGGGAGGLSISKQGGSGGSGIVVFKFISQCDPTISTNSTNNYRYSFTTTGVCNWVTPSSSTSFKVLVVGAGGGGGYDAGGGGGGGAISYNSSLTFSANEILTLTIGAGGAGGTSSAKTGVTGGTSSLVRSGSTIASSLGGSGGGGCNWNGTSCQAANSGGVGGIATASGWTTYTGASGGRGFYYTAGAGTGSAAVSGSDGTSFFSNYYSGGGGGGYNASGGLGGGGNGSSNATANTGGGGGGGDGNANGGAGGSGILLFVNDFDTPTLSWTTPNTDEIVSSASYTPSWTLSDSTSGISSSSGTAKRQSATLIEGRCGSWTTEATQTRASAVTLESENCYRWTFDSSLATGATLPVDNIGTPISSNLTSSIVKFDSAPTITSIVANENDGIYNQDKTLTFTITFKETVTVTGNPILTLETGSSDLEATCTQSSVSTTMNCSATVRSGDASSDLDYVSTSALTLPAGVTIQDLYALNNAILTLPTPGQSGSISYAKNIVVAGNSSTSATGGSVTYANGYAIHTYTSTSAGQTFVPSSTGSYEVLSVGAGGGGAAGVGSGGGGGAVIEQTVALTASTSYAISIGTGGAGHASQASDGTTTTFSNLISAPGGTGGKSRYFCQNGIGGSPGGGNGAKTGNTYPQNNAALGNCNDKSTNGGNGTLSSITGNYYGGGGGRGGESAVAFRAGGSGGLGGGGNGGTYISNGSNATANSGGGGGGGSEGSTLGGNGADGIIVIRYKIDNAAPVISWSTPSSTSYVSTASYTPVWSVTDSGIAGISNSGTVTRQYKSLSSGTCSGSWTNDGTFSSNTAQTLTANRCYQWTFSTAPVDNASNTTSTNLTSETVVYDSSAPSVSSFTATTSSPTASTSLEYQLNFSESISGLASNDFTTTGWSVAVTSGSGSGPYVISLTRTTASDGSVSLVLATNAVTDLAGNTLSSSLSSRTAAVISYDGTAPTTPTISLNSSTCSSLRNSSATASFSATDATSGLSGYRYTTDGSTPTSSSTSGSSVSVSAQGITTVKVRAIDNVGNLSGTASCLLDIDYVVPLGVWSSQPSTPTSLTSLSYVLTFDQDVTGFSSSDLSISGTATSCSASVSGSGSTYTVTLASCSQGTIQLTLLANSVTDAHGNAGPAANASATQVTRSVLSVATDYSTLSYTYGSAITAVIPVSNSGGISSVSYSISPSLPSGLSLNSSTGEITGTPSAKSSLNTYTISVADSATTATSTFTLVVAAKELTVTASSPSVTYGDSIPTITPSYSGFVLGDTSSVVTGTSCSTTYTNSSAVNTSPTTSCSGATADNYSFTYVSGTVTISPADQSTLTLTTTSGTYGTTLTLTTSGGSGTGSVTYTATTGTASSCTISGDSLTAGSAGTCLVTATKASSTNYLSASSSQTTITFAQASQSSLTVSSTSGTYGTALTLTTSGGSGTGSVTYAATTGTASSCTVSGTSLTAGSAGTCLVTATKAATTNYLEATSTQTTVTFVQASQSSLTVSSTSGTYGTTLTLTTSGGSGTGSVTYTATTGTASSCTVSGDSLTAGSAGTCLVTATKASDTNYLSVSSSQTTITFAKADQSALSVTTSSVNGIYGATYTIGTSGGSGTGNVTYSVVSGNCSLSSTTISNTSAGDCYLQAAKAADTNYNSVTSSNLRFTILPKALVLIPSSPSVTYGQSYSPTIIDTNSALVGSDAIGSATFSYSTSTPTDAGTYTITPSSAVFSSGSIDNYTVTYATGTLTIAKANQSTLTAVLASSSIEHRQTTTISSTGGSGSGSVTFSATGDCTVSGNEISTTQLGSCSLTATKAASQNYNSATSSAVTLTITGDSTVPTVVITSNSGSYSNSDTLVYSLTFSENISGLTTTDITASGWTKVITGSGSSYTLTLSSPNGTVTDGVVTVTLASGSVTDGTNLNATAVENTETIRDTTSPTSIASFASAPVSGSEDTSPQFVFSGAVAGEIYQCRINTGSYLTCSQTYKASGLSAGINTIYLRTADLAGNFGLVADFSWTIISRTSNVSTTTKSSATPTPTITKTTNKKESETTKPNISNPLSRLPDVIKPLLDNLPFLPGESLVPKQLKPDTKIPSEIKPLEIIGGKENPAELKIVEEVKTTFTNLGETVEKSEFTKSVALIVENKEGDFVKVTPLNESGPSVDTQNQRIIITAGSQIEIKANGYSPNSEFAVWLRSDPVFIGRGYVNRFGEIVAKFNLPKNVPLGEHKIELNGLTKKKEVRSVAVPATVIKNTSPGNIQLVTENPVEKYLEGLSVLMSLLWIVLMVGIWAVGATIKDLLLFRSQIRK